MKLLSFLHRGRTSIGARVEGGILDFGESSMRAFLARPGAVAHAKASIVRAKPDVRIDDVTLLPPISDPARILCVGANYREHRDEMGHQEVKHPTLFTRFASTLVAAGQPLVRPPETAELDYEGELAVVIGRSCRRVNAAQALDFVAGYTCFQDATVRDWQRHTAQFTPGKNFPATGGMGPYLVTADEIADVDNLTVSLRLNGETMQRASTAQMIFSIPTLIAYASTFTPLEPGDVIATGTPSGVGAKRMPPVFLKAGDRVEVDIEHVGVLVNGVVDESRA